MNRYGGRRKGKSAAQTLTVNDLLFCQEYLSNHRQAAKAYSKVHPNAQKRTCEVEAGRVLSKPAVVDHIALLVRAALPTTLESINADLLLAEKWAQESGDPQVLASVAMDRAKLAGFLVDKQEVKRIDEHDGAAIRQMVNSAMTQPAVLPQNG